MLPFEIVSALAGPELEVESSKIYD